MMRREYGRVVAFGAAALLVLLFLKYVLYYVLPFAVALVVVVPLHRFFLKKGIANGKGRGIMAGGILFALLLVAALIFVGLGTFMMSRVKSLAGSLSHVEESVLAVVEECCMGVETYMGLREGTLWTWASERLCEMGGALGGRGASWLTKTVQYLMSMGQLCTFALVSFICVVLFAREIERWEQGLLAAAALSPALDRLLAVLLRIGKKLGGMMKTFLKTQSIILCCISAAAATGLSLGGVSDGWLYGLLAGVMDVLPFIGTGIVLVPIAVLQCIAGRYLGALIVGVTYLVCVCIREVLEPRLMGNGTRVSPVAMLIAVYAGVLFYGISGVLLGPITLLIIAEAASEIFDNDNYKENINC